LNSKPSVRTVKSNLSRYTIQFNNKNLVFLDEGGTNGDFAADRKSRSTIAEINRRNFVSSGESLKNEKIALSFGRLGDNFVTRFHRSQKQSRLQCSNSHVTVIVTSQSQSQLPDTESEESQYQTVTGITRLQGSVQESDTVP
jgi:hypothetical protein